MCDSKRLRTGGLRAVAAVVGIGVGVALVRWGARAGVALLPVVTLAILAACVAGCAVLYRVLRYGRSMRPVRVRAEVQRAALPSPRKAIEAAPVAGTVLTAAEYAKIRSAR